ncbi:alpha/beta hydrolase [Tuanshanicoccus lijuaniae]|uniref:alpha/beta fold hydrolase n=1 Tax=Aerococcaceae bacterium zg-1292 TaxID=2774330 RepID=UPI00193751E0|nr:alpha/beta hydrolase [Aerococcaceae bacterium zg-1292]QQA37549.1 alpha/beta hydrolase [Aerococcaceae bacterium zg-1292]
MVKVKRYLGLAAGIAVGLPQLYYAQKRWRRRGKIQPVQILEEKKVSKFETEYRLKAGNNFSLFVKCYDTKEPKGLVQIVHGALEHQGRYAPLIKFLNQNGYAVIANDHRGHGRSLSTDYPKGYLNGFDEIISDLALVTDFGQTLYPDLPIYLYGHSMGSMLARLYLKEHDIKINKLVLSGTPYPSEVAPLGVWFARMINFYQGEYEYNSLISIMPKGSDWLSRSEENLQAVSQDRLSSPLFMNAGNLSVIEMNAALRFEESFKAKNPQLPILNLVGEEDTVITGGDKGLQRSLMQLKRAGYHHIQQHIYPEMRHEIIHEKNAEWVYRDMLAFFED